MAGQLCAAVKINNAVCRCACRILERLGAHVRVYDPLGLPMKDEASVEHPKVAELRGLSMWSEAQVNIQSWIAHIVLLRGFQLEFDPGCFGRSIEPAGVVFSWARCGCARSSTAASQASSKTRSTGYRSVWGRCGRRRGAPWPSHRCVTPPGMRWSHEAPCYQISIRSLVGTFSSRGRMSRVHGAQHCGIVISVRLGSFWSTCAGQRRLAELQRGEQPAGAGPLDAHDHHPQPVVGAEGLDRVCRRRPHEGVCTAGPRFCSIC